nr:cytochrome c oxidase subunit 3 [Lamproglena orientalis]WKB11718.1 cytochrome c oxidase subunit 3 [Lamproglena orientalis]
MSNFLAHPYHLVNDSPWPLLSSIAALGITSGMVKMFHIQSFNLFFMSLTLLLIVSAQWWRDVKRESTFQGLHSTEVQLGLRWGMLLFIISEVFFFISFFWAFFHSSLSVDVSLGSKWPPMGIISFNPFEIPLLNTLILLSSGISVTWAHHALMENNHTAVNNSLMITFMLGIYFTLIQGMEYYEASFSFSDSIYGSTFFLATGFHGIHVIIGSLFLITTWIRLTHGDFSYIHHFGFEASAWYWHFVDVVWLFLYISIYWWGGE